MECLGLGQQRLEPHRQDPMHLFGGAARIAPARPVPHLHASPPPRYIRDPAVEHKAESLRASTLLKGHFSIDAVLRNGLWPKKQSHGAEPTH